MFLGQTGCDIYIYLVYSLLTPVSGQTVNGAGKHFFIFKIHKLPSTFNTFSHVCVGEKLKHSGVCEG